MRQGQQNRRGRNRGGGRKPQNAMSRNYESSGPDVKIRGTAMHIAEKYASLARDAMSSGDTVAAENYLQHAEHYNRIILAAQAQAMNMPGMEGQPGMNGSGRFHQPEPFERDYDGDDDGETEDFIPAQQPQRSFSERPERPVYNQNQPQPYIPQNAFPQFQPQPVVTPAPNGVQTAQPAIPVESLGEPPAEGERMPRRRRRRPIGEHQPKALNGRGANGGATAQAPNGSSQPGESKPDEASS